MLKLYKKQLTNKQPGFTIVELLVVIVVIAILAAITIVSYTGISQRAVASALQSDLDNNSKLIKMYYTDNGEYPYSLDPNTKCLENSSGTEDTRYCLKTSNGNTLTYTYTPTSTYKYKLVATKDTTSYYTTGDISPTIGGKNLLSDENASFEGGTKGAWVTYPTTTIISTWAKHGSKALRLYHPSDPGNTSFVSITSLTIPNGTYTVSAWIKNDSSTAKTAISVWEDNGIGYTVGNYIDPGNEGVSFVTRTFGAGSTNRQLCIHRGDWAGKYPTDTYVDAIQLETGSTATPF